MRLKRIALRLRLSAWNRCRCRFAVLGWVKFFISIMIPALVPITAFAVASLAFSAKPAHSMCLTSTAENNCSTFSGDTLSQATQTYTSSNLGTNRYFQMGFRSSNGSPYTINNLAYSTDGTTFTSFSGSISTSSAFQYLTIQNPFAASPLGLPFYVRYDILPTVPAGVGIDSMFLASNTGTSTGGVLDFNGGNFEAIERAHASVPAPLPFLGAAAIASSIKRLRRSSEKLRGLSPR